MLWALNTLPPVLVENPLDALLSLRELGAPGQEIFLPSEESGPTFWPVGLDVRKIIRRHAAEALCEYVRRTHGDECASRTHGILQDIETKPSIRLPGLRISLRRILLELLPLLEEEAEDWDPSRAKDPDLTELRMRGTGPQRALLTWTLPASSSEFSSDGRPTVRDALNTLEIIVRDMESLDRRGWLSIRDSQLWRTLGRDLDGRLLAALSAEAPKHAGGRPTQAQVEERRVREASQETALAGGLFEALGLMFAEEEDD